MEDKKDLLSKKPLKAGDVFVFIALAAIVALCFITSAFSVQRGRSFDVYSKGKIVLRYSFEDGSYRIFDEAVKKTGVDEFTINCDRGYNVIAVDRNACEVTVSDADCIGKECTARRLSDGFIVCAPHSLVIKYSAEEPSPRVG